MRFSTDYLNHISRFLLGANIFLYLILFLEFGILNFMHFKRCISNVYLSSCTAE